MPGGMPGMMGGQMPGMMGQGMPGMMGQGMPGMMGQGMPGMSAPPRRSHSNSTATEPKASAPRPRRPRRPPQHGPSLTRASAAMAAAQWAAA